MDNISWSGSGNNTSEIEIKKEKKRKPLIIDEELKSLKIIEEKLIKKYNNNQNKHIHDALINISMCLKNLEKIKN